MKDTVESLVQEVDAIRLLDIPEDEKENRIAEVEERIFAMTPCGRQVTGKGHIKLPKLTRRTTGA